MARSWRTIVENLTSADGPAVPAPYGLSAAILVAIPAALCLYVAVRYFAASSGVMDPSGNAVGRDFVTIWSAAQLLKQGDLWSIFDSASMFAFQKSIFGPDFPAHNYPYPPHSLFVIAPLMHLSYLPAFVLWSAATAIILAAALRAAGMHWGLIAVLMAAPSSWINFVCGQNGFITAALCVAGFALVTRRPWLAGIMFGLLTFKPHLGLLIPVALIALRQWRAVAGAGLTLAAMVAASSLAFGWDVWPIFLETAPADMLGAGLQGDKGVAEWMIPTVFMAAKRIGLSADAALLAQIPFTMTAVIAVYLAFRRPWPMEIKMALLMTSTFLANIYGHNYDMTFTSIAVVVLMAWTGRQGITPWDLWTAALVWTLPMTIFVLNYHHVPLGPVFLAMLAGCLWASGIRAETGRAGAFARF